MSPKEKKRKKLKVLLIIEIIIFLILGLCLAGYLYIQSMWNKIHHVDLGEDIKINKELEADDSHLEGYMNIALFGIDTNGSFEKGARSDSIIIVSINNDTKDIILTSVYRDTFLDTTEGEFRKATETYALGGPSQAVNMLNVNLDLDITQFVAVDWNGLIDIINLMGGIELDITLEESAAINFMLKDTARDSKAEIHLVEATGLVNLDGVQATSYARLRAIDNDYNRSERQRKVLEAVFNKAKTMDLITLNKIANEALPKVATNIKFKDGLTFLKDMTAYKLKETHGFPFEKKSGFYNSQWILYADDLKSNVETLHMKIYGKPYHPSSKVTSISEEIKALVNGINTQPPAEGQGDYYEHQYQPQETQSYQNVPYNPNPQPQVYDNTGEVQGGTIEETTEPVVNEPVVQPQETQEQPTPPVTQPTEGTEVEGQTGE